MRLSTVFVSSAFVLAGMSTALPRESKTILVARFADSDFLAEVDARAYDEEPELYAPGGTISTKNHKSLSHYDRSKYDNDLVARGYVLSRDGSGGTPQYTSHYRRSFYEPPHYELTRRYRPDTSSSSPPTTPGFSTPPTPDFSTPPTPGTPSSRASTPPYSDWHQIPPTPGSPGGSRPSTPGWRRVPRTPGISRPTTPGSSRPSSPEGPRVPNGRSHYRRSFYDID